MADLKVTSAQDLRVGDPAHSKLSIDFENTSANVKYALYITIPTTLVAQKDMGSIKFNQTNEAAQGSVAPQITTNAAFANSICMIVVSKALMRRTRMFE